MNFNFKERAIGAGVLLSIAFIVLTVIIAGQESNRTVSTHGFVNRIMEPEMVHEPDFETIELPGAPVATVKPLAWTPLEPAKKRTRSVAKKATVKHAPYHYWTVQVGSFSQQANANQLVSALKQKQFMAYVYKQTHAGKTIYRVQVGKLTKQASAKSLQAKIKTKAQMQGLLRHR